MWIPVLIFGLLLAGAVLLAVLPGRWRGYGAATAVIIPILCLLLWLPLRDQLPLAATHTAVPLPCFSSSVPPAHIGVANKERTRPYTLSPVHRIMEGVRSFFFVMGVADGW